ncbi:MAG: metal ABC transporter substrate-binding protein [Haloferacaceae archaeon]
MRFTRRKLLSGAAGAAGVGILAGCIGGDSTADPESGGSSTADGGSDETVAAASFFVFGDVASHVTGDAAEANLLVPVGQHGHGWEPGPSVREDIHSADLFVHGMPGFQPWVDEVKGDLEADDADVTTVDASAGIDLLSAGDDHDDHDDDTGDHDDDTGDHDDRSGMDPHFWMDPLRVEEAVGNVRRGLVDVDPDGAESYAENAESFRNDLDELHEQLESTVEDASKEVILVAGHDSLQYFGDRYGVVVEALTNVSPDDRPTPRDIERAQEVIATHDLQFICADPLESQQAAEQLVAETDAEAVLPLTAMPGLTDEWESDRWGYLEVMENVNLPTLERALDA